jgi:predicted nucleic acid-binding protein
MKAVVDTNILIRALIKPRGTVGPIITRLRNGDYTKERVKCAVVARDGEIFDETEFFILCTAFD